ncbi:MAG: anion transporter [Chloroflexi bacterium]|nr:anion transporter [Chloroflexota bacterium]
MESGMTVAIVGATLLGVALGRWPGIRADRATICLIGAAALLASGVLTLEQAFAGIDLATITLLFSMMVLNSRLQLAGGFGLVSRGLVRIVRGPRTLLAAIIGLAGALAALLVNDTAVVMLTPLVLDLTRRLQRHAIPYLIGLATAANVGSVATFTGNPQNMLIGSASGLTYAGFTATLAPVALLGLVSCWAVIIVLWRDEFRAVRFVMPEPARSIILPRELRKALLVTAALSVAFWLGVPIAGAALIAAGALLFTRRLNPVRTYRLIDWNLLVFFCGLFVVVHALEVAGVTEHIVRLLEPLTRHGLVAFGMVVAVVSNLISNVPAVMVFLDVVPALDDPARGWRVLAAASTLAGNLTLLGSVANLIVAEIAARHGVTLSFRAYLRAGLPITVLTLALALLWL